MNRLIEAAGDNRYGHRDATMILLAYRHGSACRNWSGFGGSVDFNAGRLHVNRAKNGRPSRPPLYAAASYAPCAVYAASRSHSRRSCSCPSATRRSPPEGSGSWSRGWAWRQASSSRCTPTCSGTPAASSWPTGHGHPHPAGVPRPQEHPAHRQVHRAGAATVPRAVGGLRGTR